MWALRFVLFVFTPVPRVWDAAQVVVAALAYVGLVAVNPAEWSTAIHVAIGAGVLCALFTWAGFRLYKDANPRFTIDVGWPVIETVGPDKEKFVLFRLPVTNVGDTGEYELIWEGCSAPVTTLPQPMAWSGVPAKPWRSIDHGGSTSLHVGLVILGDDFALRPSKMVDKGIGFYDRVGLSSDGSVQLIFAIRSRKGERQKVTVAVRPDRDGKWARAELLDSTMVRRPAR